VQTEGRGFVVTPVIMFVQIIGELITAIYRGLITLLDISLGLCHWRYISSVPLWHWTYRMVTD